MENFKDYLYFALKCVLGAGSAFLILVFVTLIAYGAFYFVLRKKREHSEKLEKITDSIFGTLGWIPTSMTLCLLISGYLAWHDDQGLVFFAGEAVAIIIFSFIGWLISRKKKKDDSTKASTIKEKLTAAGIVLLIGILIAAGVTGIEYCDGSSYARWKTNFGVTVIGETSKGTPIISMDTDEIQWRETPDSDCFSEVAYNKYKRVLYVRFRDSGAAYRYLEFPEEYWDEFMQSESLGTWYNDYIKGSYPCQKIEE